MVQDEWRTGRRWLLPFTTGIDLPTIEQALRLAATGGATLVPVSFIAIPDGRGVRLELIQQSKDFLEALRHKALELSIPVEYHEVFTGDIMVSIATQIHDLACDSLLLASKGGKAVLLHTHEMQQLVLNPPAPLVLLRFSPLVSPGRQGLVTRLFSRVKDLGRDRAHSHTSSTTSQMSLRGK